MPINLSDQELILALATSSASLADSPGDKDNWIERAGPGGRGGELPRYVRKIARAIMKTGKSKSQAIAIAISRIKRWAAGGDGVNADTVAKAAKALAEWESLKAKNSAKKVVKLTNDDGEYIALANTQFNIDIIHQAWNALWDGIRDQYYPDKMDSSSEIPYFHPYIREVWNTFIIVQVPREAQPPALLKIPFKVHGTRVTFETPVEVKATFEKVDDSLTENETVLLSRYLHPPIIGS